MEKNKFEETHEKGNVIMINGNRKDVTDEELTFDQLINLAFDDNPPKGSNVRFEITYRRGRSERPEGILVEGQSVDITKGMIFNVTPSDGS